MEDTQKQQVDPEREALIAQMVRDATGQKTELPSELTKNPVLNPEDKDAPPTIVSRITSAGYIFVWDSRTYEKAPVLYYMLPQVLRQRRADGSWRFTTVDPGIQPKRGTLICMLHPDAPNRAHYDDLGFRVCPKDHIPNKYQVTQHMKKKHPAEWAAIEEERKERERQEDRELQKLLVTKVADQQPALAPAPETKIDDTVAIPEPEPETFPCPKCGKVYQAKGKAYRKHVKECK